MRIDLDRIIKNKSPKLYRKIPRVVIFILKRIIKVDKFNDLLDHCAGLKNVEFLTKALDFIGIRRNVVNIENIKPNERYVFVSNHPLGGLDGLVLLEILDKFSGSSVIVNDILMNVKPLCEMFVPINKHGGQNSDTSRLMTDVFNSNKQVIIFPAGLCSRRVNGKITDAKWTKTFLKKAVEHKRDIIPVFVDNVNSDLFYNIASIRKWFGVKQNIEMVLLPSEMFRNRPRQINITFGKPISYNKITEDHNLDECVMKIRAKCYDLQKK